MTRTQRACEESSRRMGRPGARLFHSRLAGRPDTHPGHRERHGAGQGLRCASLVEGVVLRIKEMGLQVRAILEDREFFNRSAISKFYELGVDFIMAAKIDKRIKKLLEQHKRENGREPAIFEYSFKAEGSPEFYLVAIPNPDYDPSKRAGPGKKDFLLFASLPA